MTQVKIRKDTLQLAKPDINPAVAVDIARIKSTVMCTSEAAEFLGLALNTMRKYCQQGYFPNADRFGIEWMIPRHDVCWWKANRLGKVGRPG